VEVKVRARLALGHVYRQYERFRTELLNSVCLAQCLQPAALCLYMGD